MIRVQIQTQQYKGISKNQFLRKVTDALYASASRGCEVQNNPSEIQIDFREHWSFLAFISRLTERGIPFSVCHQNKTLYLI